MPELSGAGVAAGRGRRGSRLGLRGAGVGAGRLVEQALREVGTQIFLTDIGGDAAADIGIDRERVGARQEEFLALAVFGAERGGLGRGVLREQGLAGELVGIGLVARGGAGLWRTQIEVRRDDQRRLGHHGEFIGRVLGGADRLAKRGAAAERQPNRRQRHELRRIQGEFRHIHFRVAGSLSEFFASGRANASTRSATTPTVMAASATLNTYQS